MKKISVIVPIYNAGKYLVKCLESIVAQTYRSLEIILVDDGSTDGSLEICKSFADKDSRIKVIHTSNHGVSWARNTGLDVASGSYVSFVDADDALEIEMYARLMAISNKSDSDIVSCDIALLPRRSPRISKDGHETYFRNNTDILNNFLTNQLGGISTCNKLIRRALIGNTRFDVSLKHNEDKLFMYEIYKQCHNYIHINYEGYLYYRREGSASNSRLSYSFFDVSRVAKIIETDILNGEYPSATKHYAKQSSILALLNLYRTMALSNNLQDFKNEHNLIRKKILGYNIGKIDYISRKRQLELTLLRYSPLFYKLVTRRYKKQRMGDPA